MTHDPLKNPRRLVLVLGDQLDVQTSAMNLKLLNPRKVLASAEQSYRGGLSPLNSAEGFIRQILGWREFVRGIYWQFMPGYAELNELNGQAPLPPFYRTGETDMNCLRETIHQTLTHGYAHHIQRMSNYCAGCAYNPAEPLSPDACPFTTLYWDFLIRHASTLKGNARMQLQLRNLTRFSKEKRRTVRTKAQKLRKEIS